MKAVPLSPGHGLLVALFYAAFMAILATSLAVRQPWLGLSLDWDSEQQAVHVHDARGPGQHITAGTQLTALRTTDGTDYLLVATDLAAEPASGLTTLTAYDEFLARQTHLAALLRQPQVHFVDTAGQVHVVAPAGHRPLADLPADFWIQIGVGAFAWLIAVAVWLFRPQEASARYLLLSGFCTSIFTSFAAVYSTRELALPGELFRWLCDLNFLGGALYCATLVALLWYYPRRVAAFPLGPVLVAVYTAWWLVQELRLVDSMLVARRSLVFAGLLATFALAALQWFGTRRDPVARAALQWFLLSWLAGTTLFSLINFVPPLFGVPAGELQGYSFVLFLLVYGGLAFGILRFRLFELGDWWFRTLTWAGGVLLLLVLDLLFLWGMELSSTLSLGLALLLCGLVWLPFRGWLWDRLIERQRPAAPNLFDAVLEVAFATTAGERLRHWTGLARRLFDPLQVTTADTDPGRVTLDNDGAMLQLPAIGGLPPLRLAYADGGRRLFTPRDRAYAEQALDMLRHADASRDAYNRGASEERARIARDLHDDIGSTLLSALHHEDPQQSKAAVQRGMTEMQTIIRGLTGQRMSVHDMLGELRHETAERLDIAGIALEWPLLPEGEAPVVNYTTCRNYLSVMRELVTNIIRHAGARHVHIDVSCTDGRMLTQITDDGTPFDGRRPADATGHGLYNIERRIVELGGQLQYTPLPNGTRTQVSLPMDCPLARDDKEGA